MAKNKRTIVFAAEVSLAEDAPYFDDSTVVPALREAMWALMVKGLFDQSFSPIPAMKFESKSDGSISRYTENGTDKADLEGFTGLIDGKYSVQINITAQVDNG